MLFIFMLQESGILSGIGWGEIAAAVVGLFVLLYALKVTLPKQLFDTTNDLLEKRTVERDDALRELSILKESSKKNLEDLEEELRYLRRENIQRMDISREDQDEIRRLKQELKALGK